MARKLLKDMTEEELREYYYNKEIEAERRGKIQAEVMKQRQEEKREEARKQWEEDCRKMDEEYKKWKQTPEYKEEERWNFISNIFAIIMILMMVISYVSCSMESKEAKEFGKAIGSIPLYIIVIGTIIVIPLTIIVAIFGNRDDSSRR